MRRIFASLLTLACLTLGPACFAGPIPATFFGMHVNQTNVAWTTFGSYRLWDDGTAWANINTSNGVYNWSPLDAWVNKAQQQNVQLLYTFGRTPTWASSSPTTSCDYAPGQCVAPSSYTYWDSFVTAIATRYKGKIKYYEIWNEPNDAGYWKGTTDQMVEMTSRAANIIHSIDPNAEVVSPGATWSSTTAWAWLDGFLTAGGGTYVDDIGFHGYTGTTKGESIFTIIDNIQKVETAHGYSLPMMITEGGWGTNTVIPDQTAQAAFLVQRYMLTTARPAVKSFFWYQWDSPTWGSLWDSTNGLHPAGLAYNQVTSWLIGATNNGCTKDASSTWTCAFTLAKGNPALAVWNGTASVAYTPGPQYSQVLGITGSSSSINGGSPYTIGNAPVLFTAPVSAIPTATLSVTPSTGIGSLTVNASVSATVAPGLTVTSTSISFDDGTVLNASSGSHTYNNPGTYNVLATVIDSLNRTATSSNTVTVTANQPPQAAISVSPSTGKAPLTVSASTASSKDADGTIASSSINFGDGTVVSGTTATHTYTAAGIYTVTATVTDNLGASATATLTATALANQPPIAKLALTQSGATVTASTAGSVDTDGTIVSTVINWGDGASINATSGSHTYTASGTYTVTATVTDDSGASTSASQSAVIKINQPPIAKLTLTQSGATATASTAGSVDPDGTIVSTVINWGDGASTIATSGSHTYTVSGTYTVTATVTDDSGASTSASQSAVIKINQPPTAKLTLTQSGATVTASTAGSVDPDGTIVSTVINWGDGASTNATSGSHTYTASGTYTVSATVTDNSGASASASQSAVVKINQPPIAKLALTQSGATVTASTAGSVDPDGTVVSTVINWGDGTSTSAASGSHTYASTGTYTVTATVTDNSGASVSASQSASVRINKAPVGLMTLTQTAAVSYKVVATASYDPDGTIASTVINWGDGSTTVATSGSHTYSAPGTYKVTVTVTDNDGASSSITGSATASWGVFVVSPVAGPVVASPVHFTASVASPNGIKSVAILVDGVTVYSGTSWQINTYVSMTSGTHTTIVQAIDNAGTHYQSAATITVQ